MSCSTLAQGKFATSKYIVKQCKLRLTYVQYLCHAILLESLRNDTMCMQMTEADLFV